ncbi:MAG: nickel-dependent hydrogenase large subunit [Candidatus Beckwithbacteria bacterium]
MHQINLDLSLEEISKIEGAAGLDLSIQDGQVTKCHFKITEYKRFYTQAVVGKAALAAPTLLARICGTCSNAHILAAIEAVENALKITPSAQTMLLRRLIINGLIIRDHALHLYLFVLPDLFQKNSLLDFNDSDPKQHQLVHDAFDVKDAGNQLSILAGGRSVHAPLPQVGGFTQLPNPQTIQPVIAKFQAVRPAVLKLIHIFADCPLTQTHSTPYLSHKNPDYSYLVGEICSSDGLCIHQNNYRSQLHHLALPYSQASAYTYKDRPYFTGALARINLNKNSLNSQTKVGAAAALKLFPSHNLYHNNLAQAIEILNAIDDTLSILPSAKFQPEPLVKSQLSSGEGFGVVEAPRGILYHHLSIENHLVKDAEILVPTGQNQLNIQNDIKILVENKLKNQTLNANLKAELEHEIEVLIRAYDPCMSCASHFLKINWKQ